MNKITSEPALRLPSNLSGQSCLNIILFCAGMIAFVSGQPCLNSRFTNMLQVSHADCTAVKQYSLMYMAPASYDFLALGRPLLLVLFRRNMSRLATTFKEPGLLDLIYRVYAALV